jgi:hydrogenase/urease accessory protein HupE
MARGGSRHGRLTTSSHRRLAITLAALIAWLVVGPPVARAHEVRPTLVTVTVLSAPRYEAVIGLNLEALLAGIGPEHQDTNDAPEIAAYTQLRALQPGALEEKFRAFAPRWLDGIRLDFGDVRDTPRVLDVTIPDVGNVALARISKVRLSGNIPTAATTVRWTYAASFGSSIVRLERPGEETTELGWLKDGQSSAEAVLVGTQSQSAVASFVQYLSLGFTHIVPKGIDHILFVVGLYLFGSGWRPLVAQVTAFTVAHSMTLALGSFGLVSVPASIVEPLIALSIVYVAVENVFATKLPIWRPLVVFGFGLLHGLGFASVLQESGLSAGNLTIALIGFNIGVELAQLFVIGVAFTLTGLMFRHEPWYRQRVVWPLSIGIALIGVFWTVQRIWFEV